MTALQIYIMQFCSAARSLLAFKTSKFVTDLIVGGMIMILVYDHLSILDNSGGMTLTHIWRCVLHDFCDKSKIAHKVCCIWLAVSVHMMIFYSQDITSPSFTFHFMKFHNENVLESLFTSHSLA